MQYAGQQCIHTAEYQTEQQIHEKAGNCHPIARIRKRLAAYGWRGERLNKEVARIVAGPDIYAERNEYSIIFPYGWEKKQLTREMRRMFPRKTGRRVLIMLDELHHFSDLREKP